MVTVDCIPIMQRQGVLLFGLVVTTLFTYVVPDCNIVGSARTNCGTSGITEAACKAKGCCYDTKTPNVPWCFTPKAPFGCPPSGATATRDDCANPKGSTVTESQCNLMDCCYDANAATKCFTVPSGSVAPQPAGCTTIPSAQRVKCGRDGISENECRQDLCCYDKTSNPKCYSPVSQVCTVPDKERVNCGYISISRDKCQNRGCCYSSVVQDVIHCFFPRKDIASQGAAQSCDIGKLIDQVKSIIENWVNLVSKPQTVTSVLDTSEIFSISTYCGVYTTAIDSVVGCARTFAGPFITGPASTAFTTTLNKIDNAKGICGAVMNQASGVKLCVPESVAICSLLSFDLLVTFTDKSTQSDFKKVCDKTEEVVRGVSTCIGLSTRGCTNAQQDEFTNVRRAYIAVADRMSQGCNQGCAKLANFLLDKDPSCTWNLPRLYPNPKIENYCQYATDAVKCSWDMWKNCRLLPYGYFQRALSVMETAFRIGGCTKTAFTTLLPGYAPDKEFEIKIPDCVDASITCAKELSFGLGVNELLGPFGGYSISQVKARVTTIGNQIVAGNYASLCGNKDQRTAKKNPISDCIKNLREKCGKSATQEQIDIVNKVVTWYNEACQTGCTELAQKIINFRTTCPDMSFAIDPLTIPVQLFLGLAPNGKNIALCQPIQHYAECVSKIITTCPFLNNRGKEARDLLVKVITKGKTKLPYVIHICGVKLDFPFSVSTQNQRAFSITQGASVLSPLSWLMALCVALILLRHT